MHTLVIGIGNPLRGDDAAGILAAEMLARTIADAGVTVLPAHQITPELAEPVSRAVRVIFIDACVGPEPGEIRERPIRASPQSNLKLDVRATSLFTHHASPEALLSAALALYGRAPKAWLFSLAGSDFGYSAEPSPGLIRRVESLVTAVLRRIGPVAPDLTAL